MFLQRLGHGAVEEIRVADEGGHETRARRFVDFLRRAELFDPAQFHYRQAVRQAHGLALVVRHVQECDADLVVNQVQFNEHALAELEVQRGQRLVQQQHPRLVHQRPRDRHPLFLAARNLVGLLPRLILHLDQGQHLGHLRLDLLPGAFGDLQPESDIVPHRQVRKQRIALEDGVDLALVGRQVRHVLSAQQHPSGVRLFEPGQDPQERGLAAAARTQQGKNSPA